MFEQLNKVILDYSNEVVRLARRNLNLSGFAGRKNRKSNSTGDLSKGLGYEIKENKTGLVVEFTSKEKYGRFVEEGRKKGSQPPSDALEKYIKDKPIRLKRTRKNKAGQRVNTFVPKNEKTIKSAAFAMAKKIKKDGIKEVPYMGEAMNEAFEKLPPKAAEALVKDLGDIIIEDFQKLPNITVKEI